MKKLFLLLMLLPFAASAADISIRGEVVDKFEDGRAKGTATFTYAWYQGPNEANLRQVGETPSPVFERLNQADTIQCFAYVVLYIDPTVPIGGARRILDTSNQGPVTCRDFSTGVPPPLTTKPATPGAPTVESKAK